MQKGLVSILTPCFNTGHLIHFLLDSVLSQTYSYVEMFVIDDGSNDNTADVVSGYVPVFTQKGYSLTYLYQDNLGQSVAIRNGLQMINGEFLIWPDSDDFFASPDALTKMVEKLNSAPLEFAMVRCLEKIVDEDTRAEIRVVGNNSKEEEERSLFNDCLFNTNGFFWGAGAYMVRVAALKETTDFDIYTEKNAGQNWQIFLPILYSYRCLTIKKVLYAIVERRLSHGRSGYAGYEKLLVRISSYENTILETLRRIKQMRNAEKDDYICRIKDKYSRERMRLAFDYRKRTDYVSEYRCFRERNRHSITLSEKICYCSVLTHTEYFYCLLSRLKRMFA